MTFDIHIHFDDQSPEAMALGTLVSLYHISPEEALKRSVTTLAAHATDPDNFDYLFTPEKIALIRAAEAEAETGNNITMEQVKANLKVKRQAWLSNHSG
jgi:uncharacterized protein YcbX